MKNSVGRREKAEHTIQRLLAEGMSPIHPNAEGHTVLGILASESMDYNSEWIQGLLQQGANPLEHDVPLAWAASLGKRSYVQELGWWCVHRELTNGRGQNLFHILAPLSVFPTCRNDTSLLISEAQRHHKHHLLNAQDDFGNTPLHLYLNRLRTLRMQIQGGVPLEPNQYIPIWSLAEDFYCAMNESARECVNKAGHSLWDILDDALAQGFKPPPKEHPFWPPLSAFRQRKALDEATAAAPLPPTRRANL